MEKKPIQVDLMTLPKEIRPFLQDAQLYDSSCGAAAKVIYSDRGFYIKMAEKTALAREAEMTALFAQNGIGVPLLAYVTEGDKDYMVTEAAVGEDLTMMLDEPKKICRIMAEGMQHLHRLDMADMPLSPDMVAYTEAGYGEQMPADTCIHGDFCLPNVICRDGKFGCLIDMGQAGRGNRHIDLYWALWSLQFNLKTDKYTDYFLDAYGGEWVDKDRLRIAQLVEG